MAHVDNIAPVQTAAAACLMSCLAEGSKEVNALVGLRSGPNAMDCPSGKKYGAVLRLVKHGWHETPPS